MWARLTELAFGLWLLASPFVFAHSTSATSLWAIDLSAGALLLVSTGLNYRFASRRWYLGVPVLGACLIGSAFLAGPHPLPLARQNDIMVGFIIMMLGVVPNRALQPPGKWASFEGSGGGQLDGDVAPHDADRREGKRGDDGVEREPHRTRA